MTTSPEAGAKAFASAGLDGRVAVITGAGGGIGRATAQAVAELGAAVVACDASEAAAVETADIVRRGGREAIAMSGDVSKYEDMAAVAETACAAFGKVDILACCAGLFEIRRFEEGDVSHWQRLIAANFLGVAITIKAVLPAIHLSDAGHVVIMASESGRMTYPGEAIYIASKWATVGLGGSLRAELKEHAIKVTLIEPGIVDTPNLRKIEAATPEFDAAQPLLASDVACAVVYAVTQPRHVNISELLLQPSGFVESVPSETQA